MFKVSTLLSCMQNICRNDSLRDTGRRIGDVFVASLPDVLLEAPLFGRDRCRCMTRDAAV